METVASLQLRVDGVDEYLHKLTKMQQDSGTHLDQTQQLLGQVVTKNEQAQTEMRNLFGNLTGKMDEICKMNDPQKISIQFSQEVSALNQRVETLVKNDDVRGQVEHLGQNVHTLTQRMDETSRHMNKILAEIQKGVQKSESQVVAEQARFQHLASHINGAVDKIGKLDNRVSDLVYATTKTSNDTETYRQELQVLSENIQRQHLEWEKRWK